ncbi:MAG TPA: flagellar hook-length control protein FliK [Gammaproteobacteria bacterium]|nr:flagellar hook-length control protein FliK [Gammaproteobacteria bacterium]
MLARQVETAYHWVRDGTLALDLPLIFDGREVLAHLRFRRGPERDEDGNAEPPAGGKGPAGVFFDFALDPPGLGPLRAQAHVAGSRLAVRFLAASADTTRLIGDALPALRASVEQAGLSLVHAEATTDPDGARPAPLPSPVLPRGGSVLDARA